MNKGIFIVLIATLLIGTAIAPLIICIGLLIRHDGFNAAPTAIRLF
jgi:hypothetical protein